jgi:sugar lactone lactonase YvrE
MVWTAGRKGNTDEVILIDGDAGVVVDTVSVPGLNPDIYGLYGGAVDAEGNFWATGWAAGNQLVRVRLDDMSVTVWDGPPSNGEGDHWSGMTVDVNGFVWNCAERVARFDPQNETWTVSSPILYSGGKGCMADDDPNGLIWVGGGWLVGIDRQTFERVHLWETPLTYGISLDFQGYVWGVFGSGAHRVDPDTGDVTSYEGLDVAYTYSDMTGFALKTVGGTPAG